MNFLKTMLREERRLMSKRDKIDGQINQLRGAINALSGGSGNGIKHVRATKSPLKGRKLSAAHRRAIREGIAKAKAK